MAIKNSEDDKNNKNNSDDVVERTKKAFAPPTERQKKLQEEAKAKGGLTERGIRQYYTGSQQPTVQSETLLSEIKQSDARRNENRSSLSKYDQSLIRKIQESRSGDRPTFKSEQEFKRAVQLESSFSGRGLTSFGTKTESDIRRDIRSGAVTRKQAFVEGLSQADTVRPTFDKPVKGVTVISYRKVVNAPKSKTIAQTTPTKVTTKDYRVSFQGQKIDAPSTNKNKSPITMSFNFDKKGNPIFNESSQRAYMQFKMYQLYPMQPRALYLKENVGKVEKLTRKIQGKIQQGALGAGLQAYTGISQTYTDNKGNIIRNPAGSAAKLAMILGSAAAAGIGTGVAAAKLVLKYPKAASLIKTIGKGGSMLWVAGVPLRVVQHLGRPDELLIEFAGDVGYLGGLKYAGLKLDKISKTKVTSNQAKKVLKNAFGNKRITEKSFTDTFKNLKTNSEKVKLVKSYIKEYGKMPPLSNGSLKSLAVKSTSTKTTGKLKKGKLFSKKNIPATQKDRILTVKGKLKSAKLYQKLKRKLKSKEKREIVQKSKLEKKTIRKKIIQIAKQEEESIKQALSKLNRQKEKIKNAFLRSKKLFDKKLTDKAARTDHVLINGKKKYYLPISKKYHASRKKYLSELKALAKLDSNFLDDYENFKNSDILVRTYEALTPSQKPKKSIFARLLKERADAFKTLVNKIKLKQKLITNQLKQYALLELKTVDKPSTSPKPIKGKAPKSEEVVLEVKNDKGRLQVTKSGKVYVYQNVDIEKKISTGQKVIMQQEVLVKVKQVPPKQKVKIQQVQATQQETVTKQKVQQVQVTEQVSMQSQRQVPVTKQKVSLIANIRQIQEARQLQKQIQIQETQQLQGSKQKQILAQALKQAQIQKLAQLQTQLQKQKVMQKLKQTQKLKLKTKQQLLTELKQLLQQKLITQTTKIKIPKPPKEKPPKVPDIPFFRYKVELLAYLKKLPKKNYSFEYTPTLSGVGAKATRTTGTFSGFEVRGSVIRPVVVHKHKRKSLVHKKFVRKHHRRKPR